MQDERESIVRQFSGKYKNILVATDVASRGLHIDNVKYIINFDFPSQIETYVHRIGRTGRAGSTGTAYAFFTKKDFMLGAELAGVLRRAGQEVPEGLLKYARLAESTKSGAVVGGWVTKGETEQVKDMEEVKKEEVKEKEKVVVAKSMGLNEVARMLNLSTTKIEPKVIQQPSPKPSMLPQPSMLNPLKPNPNTSSNPVNKKKWGKK